MSDLRQIWLVALREMRERSRSRALWIGLAIMLVVVVGAIVLPTVLKSVGGTKDVGMAGSYGTTLPGTITAQGNTTGTTIHIHTYSTVGEGEQAVRNGDVDVLVVDGQRLEWPRRIDNSLQSIVTAAIQVSTVSARAAAAGISADALAAVLAPIPVQNVELTAATGSTTDDEAAAMIMTILLFTTIATYGNLVLTGVVEEKSSRVVEVLLARIPARNLIAGKVAGIGLLGLGQFGITAVAALIAAASVQSADIPAASPVMIGWVVAWFVLGYAIYATVYGALGSLASRTEDAQSVAGPVTVVLVVGYFATLATVSNPASVMARLLSYFPATAPLSMPTRIAMGATAWWEPLLAVVLAVATIAALVGFAGRVYTKNILRSGPSAGIAALLRRGGPRPARTNS